VRVVFEQLRSGFVRFGSYDDVCRHDVLDIFYSLRRRAFGLPEWTSPVYDGGRVFLPPIPSTPLRPKLRGPRGLPPPARSTAPSRARPRCRCRWPGSFSCVSSRRACSESYSRIKLSRSASTTLVS
jgi:hypothetical protein